MTMAAAAVGILRPPTALRSYAAPRWPAASCSFQLRAAPAHLLAMPRLAPRLSPHVAPRLRSADLSGEGACVAQDDERVVVVVPPWVPSEEEVDEFLALDMSWAAIHERFSRESVEAWAAVVGAVADVLRPLRDNFSDLRSLKYVHDTEEFHIGMPFGALMTCIGLYQLWKVAPNLCLDVAMPYAFYKLSVLAADVRRRGFSPDLIIRIKLALGLAMFMKDIQLKCTPLDLYVRVPVYFMYTLSVLYDLTGIKKMAKYPLAAFIYQVVCFFQNSKSVFDPDVKLVDGAKKVDGVLVQCELEPDKSMAKEDGETLQLLQEPAIDVEVDNSSSVIEDGKLPQITAKSHHATAEEDAELQFVSDPGNAMICGAKEAGETMQLLQEPAIDVEVDNSSSEIEEGELPHSTAKSHHTTEEEDSELQFVSEPANSMLRDEKEGCETMQLLQEPAIDVEVDSSSIEIEDGKLPQSTAKSHHTTEEDAELQFVSEPGNSMLCGANEGGETIQLLQEPAIDVEVDNSINEIDDGKLPHSTAKSHHTSEEEDAELQFISELGDSGILASNLKEESELTQFVSEPDQ